MAKSDNNQSMRPFQAGVVTVGSGLLLLIGIALGLLFLVLGAGTGVRVLSLIGAFIFPMSLFAGGLFWSEESLAVRITLMGLAGLFVISVFGNFWPL